MTRTFASSPGGGGSSTPGGDDTQLQFNDGGAFGGDSGLAWDKTDKLLTLTRDAIGTTQSDSYGLRLRNTTAAVNNAPQYSPALVFQGQEWSGGGGGSSKQVEWRQYAKTMSGLDATRISALSFEGSIDNGTYKPVLQTRFSASGAWGVDVIGTHGLVHQARYNFSIQDNSAYSYMQILNNVFSVEGTAFFGAEDANFVQYGTEGGGIYLRPNTDEALEALTVGAEGNNQMTTSAIAGAPVLTLNQMDDDQPFLNFAGTSAANLTKSISTYTTEGGTVRYIKAMINGVAYWLRACTAPTA